MDGNDEDHHGGTLATLLLLLMPLLMLDDDDENGCHIDEGVMGVSTRYKSFSIIIMRYGDGNEYDITKSMITIGHSINASIDDNNRDNIIVLRLLLDV